MLSIPKVSISLDLIMTVSRLKYMSRSGQGTIKGSFEFAPSISFYFNENFEGKIAMHTIPTWFKPSLITSIEILCVL